MTPPRPRIAYFTSAYPAPSHTFIRREVLALRRRGVEVDTFSVRGPTAHQTLGAEDEDERARTFYVLPAGVGDLLRAHARTFARRPGAYLRTLAAALRHRAPGLRGLVWGAFYFVEAMRLADELDRRGVRHLHNHFANPAANVGHLASSYLGIPWSLTLHGISEFDYPAGLMLPTKLEAARFVSCASYFVMAQAMRTVPAAVWPKMTVVRCGIDPRALPPVAPRGGGRPTVVCVGRLSPEKGQAGLVDAFAALRASGVDAQLRLVGDGPERAAIEARVTERGLRGGDACVLLGQQPEDATLREIAAADVLVCSSFMEGLPVVLMEALALGVPVVAPRVAGIPELVEEGVTGLLFTPGRFDELGTALGRLLADSALRRRLGEAGRARVLAEFDADKAIEPLVPRFG